MDNRYLECPLCGNNVRWRAFVHCKGICKNCSRNSKYENVIKYEKDTEGLKSYLKVLEYI